MGGENLITTAEHSEPEDGRFAVIKYFGADSPRYACVRVRQIT
jgi:hypothetical protein